MKAIRHIVRATLLTAIVCAFPACPNPDETFTIHIVNVSESITVNSLTLARVGQISALDVTDNLLRRDIRPGNDRDVIVSINDVGDANGISMLLDGAPTQRNSREIPEGFAAGSTIDVSIDGNVRSVEIEIDVTP